MIPSICSNFLRTAFICAIAAMLACSAPGGLLESNEVQSEEVVEVEAGEELYVCEAGRRRSEKTKGCLENQRPFSQRRSLTPLSSRTVPETERSLMNGLGAYLIV